ncbi:hypothetical protein SA19023_22100 [Staphylococcus argenteus]|nr:hypothetical protein SA19023_22100 [Staphylococcus argenteus]
MSPFLLLRVRNQCAKNATRQPLIAVVMMLINKLNIRHTPPLRVKVTPEMLGDHYIISFIYYISHNIKTLPKYFLVVYATLIAIF